MVLSSNCLVFANLDCSYLEMPSFAAIILTINLIVETLVLAHSDYLKLDFGRTADNLEKRDSLTLESDIELYNGDGVSLPHRSVAA